MSEYVNAEKNSDISTGKDAYNDQMMRLKNELETADAVVIGAGIGLSTSAGLIYSGERFNRYFGDFSDKYGFRDMYSGGFYPYGSLEEQWAFWSRYIYINRFARPVNNVYDRLYELVDGRDKGDIANQPRKDYFVITTNVDHQFKKAGFSKRRIFYSQGDFGLWQCRKPCHKRTYDNKDKVIKMLVAQGFAIGEDRELIPPVKENGETDFDKLSMTVPTGLVPYCPVCGEPMVMNLNTDSTFVEDDGWYEASGNYSEFLDSCKDLHVLFIELGVGSKTPAMIKYPFWNLVRENENAVYCCINKGEAYCPKDIEDRSICIDADIGEVINGI